MPLFEESGDGVRAGGAASGVLQSEALRASAGLLSAFDRSKSRRAITEAQGAAEERVVNGNGNGNGNGVVDPYARCRQYEGIYGPCIGGIGGGGRSAPPECFEPGAPFEGVECPTYTGPHVSTHSGPPTLPQKEIPWLWIGAAALVVVLFARR
jgi:hypothetical protein